ncbi:hypothetical protein HGRIS_004576 [Hohenbuehelia grisea]|uniref:Calcineurin-like phosphoesterase domain-containing protein n=1 Tax=Hohenbuehelia grisea TaxID=104357 RepID=A0ABR3JCP8_9AGAR
MAVTAQRLNRTAKVTCAPMSAIIGFSLLLTYLFVLYQPTRGPGIIQRVGWQSWDVIGAADSSNTATTTAASSPTASAAPARPPQVGLGNGGNQESVDWWNVTSDSEKPIDFASLPLDVWNPLLPHDTGLSEITVTRCMVNPKMAGNICSPFSTSTDESHKGKWVRLDEDLNRKVGAWYLHIYYRRTRRQDIPLVDNVVILPADENPTSTKQHLNLTNTGIWHKVTRSLRDGVPRTPPLYLWYHTSKTLAEMTAEEKENKLVTELDVVHGEGPAWYGFTKVEPAITEEQEGRHSSVSLIYRRGVKIPPKAPPLHFSHAGKFKILQIADLHFSVSRGKCRDPPFSPCERSDNLTNTLLARMIDAEKPDLVVFSGDQLNGQGTSWDAASVLMKVTRIVVERGLPWAAVFGNHDSEDQGRYGKDSREEQIRMMQALPYSLVERGPKDIHGVGNYMVKVKSADPSKTHLLSLYFLDSGSYSKGLMDWFGFFTPTEYDYIRQNQIDWFLKESSQIKPIERPFHPDGGKDLGGLWQRQQVTPQTRKLAKPNALMFFHIPLQESYDIKPDIDPATNKALDVGLHNLEKGGAPKRSDGFFEKALLKAKESEHVSNEAIPEVKVVGNGHCHVTENCRRVKGVWLCFGGGGSYSGYGKPGFDRRFRVYEISNYGETIRTYKRTEKDEILDDMVLAGVGAPAFNVS